MAWKIHGIASGGSKMVTYCGIVGYSTKVSNEFETDRGGTFTGGRIECAPMNDNRTVTCKRCLKAISEAPKGGMVTWVTGH